MSGTAHADVFTVDGLQDAPDDGHTTLRDAIADAEKPAASGSTITVTKKWCKRKEHKRSAESAKKKKCTTKKKKNAYRGVQMLRRILFASALAIAGLVLAAPAGASAATTLGETFAATADGSCVGTMAGYEVVQVHRASGPSYAAPSPGVLTSWSFEGSSQPTTLTLRVFRPTGTPQEFTVIAEGGPLQTIGASSGLHTFLTQISVAAGDLIGIHSTDGACANNTLSSGDIYDARLLSIVPIGMSGIYSEGSGKIFDISASLEPDCDNDGLGDETQDSNVTAACPTPSSPGTTGSTGQQTTKKKCKKHKKKHKRSAESAKKKKCKKKKKKR
jgi:hypothetical protein